MSEVTLNKELLSSPRQTDKETNTKIGQLSTKIILSRRFSNFQTLKYQSILNNNRLVRRRQRDFFLILKPTNRL